MMVLERYNIELVKISNLKLAQIKGFRFSNILLFREYQSRLHKWKVGLNSNTPDWFNKRKDYHNLFIDLSPQWLDCIISEEKVIKDLTDLGINGLENGFRDYRTFFLRLYINWEIFKDKPEISNYSDLSHPYETVFKIIIRGGSINFADNKFVIDDRFYLKYDNVFTLPSIEDEFLDFVDSKVSDFPNQERVNQLWTEYQNKI